MKKVKISELPISDLPTGLELIPSALDGKNQALSVNVIAIFTKNMLRGKANGLAPLDADALVPERHLPGSAFGVMPFEGSVSGVIVETEAAADKGYKMAGCSVVYNSDSNRFVLEVAEGDTKRYFGSWSNFALHGRHDSDGSVIPRSDKVFIHPKGGGLAYIWTGTRLALLTTDSLLAKDLSQKADKTTMNTELAKKVDKTTMNTELAKKVDKADLPNVDAIVDASGLVEFGGFTSVKTSEIKGRTSKKSTDAGCLVLFNPITRRFLLYYGGAKYSAWADSDRFGVAHISSGVTPYPHRTYFCMVDDTPDGEETGSVMVRNYYRWNGYTLSLNHPYDPALVHYAYDVEADDKTKFRTVSDTAATAAWEDDPTIVYTTDRQRFMLLVTAADGGLPYLYPKWGESADYGTPAADGSGIIPHPFKTFRNSVSGEFQQWNGSELTTPLSAYEVQTALSDVTATYAAAINTLRAELDALVDRVAALETRFAGGVLLL